MSTSEHKDPYSKDAKMSWLKEQTDHENHLVRADN